MAQQSTLGFTATTGRLRTITAKDELVLNLITIPDEIILRLDQTDSIEFSSIRTDAIVFRSCPTDSEDFQLRP